VKTTENKTVNIKRSKKKPTIKKKGRLYPEGLHLRLFQVTPTLITTAEVQTPSLCCVPRQFIGPQMSVRSYFSVNFNIHPQAVIYKVCTPPSPRRGAQIVG
jgi:hypothetical protein